MRHHVHVLRPNLPTRQATAALHLTLSQPLPLLLPSMGLLILQPQMRLMLQPARMLPMPRSMLHLLLLLVTRRRASMWPTRVVGWHQAPGMQPRLLGIRPQCWPWRCCPQGEIPVTARV